jgi:hypothetical protein
MIKIMEECMQGNKERDRIIKEKLLEKYGYLEFKARWDELAEFLDLNMQKVRYHIFKLESQGFLRVIEKSVRSGGFTSPNIIQILGAEETNDVPIEKVLADIKERTIGLEKKALRVDVLEEENARLRNEKRILQEKYDNLYNEAFDQHGQGNRQG